MAAGDLTYTYDVLVFGDGTNVDVRQVDGLLDVAGLRIGDVNRPADHGSFPGMHLLGPRVFTFTLDALDPLGATSTLEATIEQATAPRQAESPLTFQIPGRTQRAVNCRPTRRRRTLDLSDTLGIKRYVVEFQATDPRMYDAAWSSVAIPLPTASGGLTFPVTPPFTFGSATGGQAVVTNAGNFTAPWVATFVGPLQDPSVSSAGLSVGVYMVGTLNAGETLVVDSAARTVLLNGTASRESWLLPTSRWFGLSPGANTIQLGATTGSGSLTFAYRSCWL